MRSLAQTPVIAQKFQSLEPPTYNPWQHKVSVWLEASAGLSLVDCYDAGTIPFKYKGWGFDADLGTTIEWGRCHIEPKAQIVYATLNNLGGTVTDVNLSTEFLYHFSRINRMNFWAGGTLQGFMDLKSIPVLMNAATSISLFGNLCATGLWEYDFAVNREKTHSWLTAFCKLNLPLFGLANRPSYSYIGNPTVNDGDLSYLKEQETFGKFFPGLGTELGLCLNLLNDNHIKLSYRWDYLTTGQKDANRFDHAIHAINLSFQFRTN